MIDWNKLKTDWKTILKNPDTVSNVDTVVNGLVDALKVQIDAAVVIGVDSRGDTLTNGSIE